MLLHKIKLNNCISRHKTPFTLAQTQDFRRMDYGASDNSLQGRNPRAHELAYTYSWCQNVTLFAGTDSSASYDVVWIRWCARTGAVYGLALTVHGNVALFAGTDSSASYDVVWIRWCARTGAVYGLALTNLNHEEVACLARAPTT